MKLNCYIFGHNYVSRFKNLDYPTCDQAIQMGYSTEYCTKCGDGSVQFYPIDKD